MEGLLSQHAQLIVRSGIRYDEAISLFRKAVITSAMQQFSGNQCRAARALGIHRNTLSRLLDQFDLPSAHYRWIKKPAQSTSAPAENVATA